MKPALIVIDMLEEFVYGRLKSPSAVSIVPAIKSLIDSAREKNVPVIFVADRHFSFDRELEIWGPHAMYGSKDAEIISELRPADKDIVLYKRSYSGFRETGLSYILRDLRVDTVILTGIHTHICVLHTAIDAFYERLKIILVKDAVAALSQEDHEYAVKYMQQVLGALVMDVKQVLELFEKSSTFSSTQ